MLVIVNPTSGGGRAKSRWSRIRLDVERRIGHFEEYIPPDVSTVRAHVIAALEAGERRFVAAGGDGTVNLVVGLLMELAPAGARSELVVGAIGLGSSNDFHKQDGAATMIGPFPCRLDFATAAPHDIGCTRYVDDDGCLRLRRWLINASVGVTARGNWLYNEANGLIRIAKKYSASLGMVMAAFRALLEPPGQPLTLTREDGSVRQIHVLNLGVVKNPNFTGCLRYDSPYRPGSGDFFVHLLADTSPWRALVTLARLARGRFLGEPGTESWQGRWLALDAPRPFPIEGDGEVVLARRVEFHLEPRAIRVCAR